jgi:hypothetical protein
MPKPENIVIASIFLIIGAFLFVIYTKLSYMQDSLIRNSAYSLMAIAIISIIMAIVAIATDSTSIIIVYGIISSIALGIIGTLITGRANNPYIKSWGMYVIVLSVVSLVGCFIIKALH